MVPRTSPSRSSRDGLSRRRLLGSLGLLAVTSGCLTDTSPATSPGTEPTDSETTAPDTTAPDTTTDGTTTDSTVTVAEVTVSDYVVFPLASVHPHVYRQSGTQYVVVRVATGRSADVVRRDLSLQLDGTAATLAERQPVPWESDTVDVAFAVSKSESYDSGTVLLEGAALHSLSNATLDRLNHPPVFTVSAPSVSPDEIQYDERVTATVRFSLANTGEGTGTFGASLKGNYVSGSKTVTATLDPGAEREVQASVTLVGSGESATVRLDWGADEWTAAVPVVGRPTTTEGTPSTPVR